ncbi:TPA: hypothetical protein NU929_003342 [Vibrio cholerae]|uniref:Uncharacterized protein n=2 Tax=Vibrionaceae TaxID=641 RepID=A0A0H3ZQC6_VIBSP|nr:hypothetical protein [Vibrio splendidus]AKN40567.1 hypothetical protein [Enterovibrio norvegicus]HCJ6874139.1 hypothetical protein [Vibrio cholerae]
MAYVHKVLGSDLLTAEQQEELDTLSEASHHRDTMRFTALDAVHLDEYYKLCERLQREYYLEREIEDLPVA